MPVEDREDRGAIARRYRARSISREHGGLWVVARSVLSHFTTQSPGVRLAAAALRTALGLLREPPIIPSDLILRAPVLDG